MPILIPVDPGYAFDYLSILAVKYAHGIEVELQFDEISKTVSEQIGESLFLRILNSGEYHSLMLSNMNLFTMVDKAEKDLCSASVVQRANRDRYNAKVALQRAFFNGEKVSEIKT